MTNKSANIRIKDRPNKVRAKLIIDVEGEFYDDESTAETLRYCVEQDLEDAGFNVIDSEVFKLANKVSEQQPKTGHWKAHDTTFGRNIYYCTACGRSLEILYEYDFCPICGAKMEVE